MKKKSIIKMILDLLMTILLPLLMIQAIAGEEVHEWIGIFVFLLFIMHHLINFNWHENLLKGNYNTVRSIGTFVNVGILICMILSAISGVLLSQYVFAFLDLSQGLSFARASHMICTHWLFVLTSFHIGMHLKVMKNYIEQFSKRKLGIISGRVLQILSIFVAIYGVKVFIETKLWQYMFYQVKFMFYDFNRMAFSVYLDYISMIVLFAVIGYFLSDRMKKISMAKGFIIKARWGKFS